MPWLIKGHDYCHAGRQCRASHMKQIHCSTPLFLLHTVPAVVTGTAINTNQFRYYLFLSKENVLISAEILVENWQMLYNLLSLGLKKSGLLRMIGYFPLTTIVSLTVVQCTLSIDVTKPSYFQALLDRL